LSWITRAIAEISVKTRVIHGFIQRKKYVFGFDPKRRDFRTTRKAGFIYHYQVRANASLLHLLFFCILSMTVSGCSDGMQPESVVALAERIQSGLSGYFIFELTDDCPEEQFEIESKGDKIVVRGSTLSSMTAGLGWYLKYVCHSGNYWTLQRPPVPVPLPEVKRKISRQTGMKHRYYMNYCVDMYNSRYWDWERWEKEVDWMALNGVNIALVQIDRSAAMQNVVNSYTAQNRESEKPQTPSGNMHEYEYGLHSTRIQLQQTVIARMRELGISPMLDGFKGYIPKALAEKITSVDFRDGGEWCGQPKDPFVAVTDPFFEEFGARFYREQKKLYGDQLFIDADPIVEGSVPEGTDLSEVGVKVQNLILGTYPDATWVLQGWQANPRAELLAGTNPERTLILDLWCETQPQWREREVYSSTPWVWGVINNFGGNTGMFGNIDLVFDQQTEAKSLPQGKFLCGVGALMEGIENNPLVYNMVFESAWMDTKPDMKTWLSDYAASRYGKHNVHADRAWAVMHEKIYTATRKQEGTTENIMCARPKLKLDRVSTWGTAIPYFTVADIAPAWDEMLLAAQDLGESDGFLLDLADLTRQIVSNYAWELYPKVIAAHRQGDKEAFERLAAQYLTLFDDMNSLLLTRKEFMVGPWIETFRRWGTDEQQKRMLEQAAKTYISTWSEKVYSEEGRLHDYAFREWAGTMTDLYKARYETYFTALRKMTDPNVEPVIDWYGFDYAWITSSGNYPVEPVGHTVEVCKILHDKYRNQL
jgi:alpha-N-acetylglucosaminidase